MTGRWHPSRSTEQERAGVRAWYPEAARWLYGNEIELVRTLDEVERADPDDRRLDFLNLILIRRLESAEGGN